jgi:nitrate/TMAO reductase-like tetraheme cytochrome c subunit
LNEKYYPQKSCNQCHVADSWAQVAFDHNLTGFELEGKHEKATCVACHKPDITPAPAQVSFTGLKPECISCHDNVHEDQFEVEGVTDCKRCHAFEAWKPSNFDHNTARFVLDGAHKKVSCDGCHKEEIVEGKSVIQYKYEQFECATCHK